MSSSSQHLGIRRIGVIRPAPVIDLIRAHKSGFPLTDRVVNHIKSCSKCQEHLQIAVPYTPEEFKALVRERTNLQMPDSDNDKQNN